jgi:hypothetical protein
MTRFPFLLLQKTALARGFLLGYMPSFMMLMFLRVSLKFAVHIRISDQCYGYGYEKPYAKKKRACDVHKDKEEVEEEQLPEVAFGKVEAFDDGVRRLGSVLDDVVHIKFEDDRQIDARKDKKDETCYDCQDIQDRPKERVPEDAIRFKWRKRILKVRGVPVDYAQGKRNHGDGKGYADGKADYRHMSGSPAYDQEDESGTQKEPVMFLGLAPSVRNRLLN